jgi:Xaa-Pro aminopeptidase
LTELDRKTLRALGRSLTLAVEATCRKVQPGETEADVAGQLSHRLIREGIVPVEIRVAGDDRLTRFRQPGFKAVEILKKVCISATGRRLGLCASVSRTVSFGHVDNYFRSCHTLSAMVIATCMFFSAPGEPVSEVFRRARRIFEKFDHPHEWSFDYQGALIGYSPRELMLLPDCTSKLQAGYALRWSPSVVAARSEDTMLIDEGRFSIITNSRNWPMLDVTVKGHSIPRPAILER